MRNITTKIGALLATIALITSCSDDTSEFTLQLDYTYVNDSSYTIHIYDAETLNDDLIVAVIYDLKPGESQTYTRKAATSVSEDAAISSYCNASHLYGQTLEIFNEEYEEESQILETLEFGYNMNSDTYSPLNRSEYTAEQIDSDHLEFSYTFTDNGLAELFNAEEE